VSSFQLEWVEHFRPRVGCLINLTPDHLDRHGSFESYAAAKARLFARQQAEDFAVLNRDDAVVWRVAEHLGSRLVSFGAAPVPCGAFAGEGYVALRLPGAGEERYDLARIRLVGRHNLENVLAAVTVARLAGAPARRRATRPPQRSRRATWPSSTSRRSRPRCGRRRSTPGRATSSCSRPPARASTCSRTTPPAAVPSGRRSRPSGDGGGDAGAR